MTASRDVPALDVPALDVPSLDVLSLDVAVCCDRRQFPGLEALVRSALVHAEDASRLAFHVLVAAGEAAEARDVLERCIQDCADGAPRPACEVLEFEPPDFLERYLDEADFEQFGLARSSARMNYSRFCLGELFPRLGKAIYLDADVVAQAPLEELWRRATLAEHPIAAVPITTFAGWHGGVDLDAEVLSHLDPAAPVFNAGVFVTDLEAWRGEDFRRRIEHWIDVHRRRPGAFVFGTQAIMNLVFYEKVELLEETWNLRPLGYAEDIPDRRLRRAKILHWAGKRKPWLADGLYKDYWTPYAAPETSER